MTTTPMTTAITMAPAIYAVRLRPLHIEPDRSPSAFGAAVCGPTPRANSVPELERKPAFWRFLVNDVEPVLRDVPAVVVGDLNTGLHYRDEPGATLVCAAEMAEFETRGWRDGWISRNPLARPPATWWSPQAKTPYRLDHALVSPASPRLRHVDYPERLDNGTPFVGPGGLSDHLPLVIDLP